MHLKHSAVFVVSRMSRCSRGEFGDKVRSSVIQGAGSRAAAPLHQSDEVVHN